MAITFHPDGRIIHNGVNVASKPMIDRYALTDPDITAATDPLTNWGRITSGADALLGSAEGGGMSLSSGIFTFPSTGFYLILWSAGLYFSGSGDTGAGFNLHTTANNGTSWKAYTNIDIGYTSATLHGHITDQAVLDITDVSQQKVKFITSSFSSGTKVKTNNSQYMTNCNFIKLADT